MVLNKHLHILIYIELWTLYRLNLHLYKVESQYHKETYVKYNYIYLADSWKYYYLLIVLAAYLRNCTLQGLMFAVITVYHIQNCWKCRYVFLYHAFLIDEEHSFHTIKFSMVNYSHQIKGIMFSSTCKIW